MPPLSGADKGTGTRAFRGWHQRRGGCPGQWWDSLSASAWTPLADVAGDRHPPFLGAHKLKRILTKSQATWASVIPLLDLLFLL